MKVVAEIESDEESGPPIGAPVIVQVRDTTRQDAPAVILGEARSRVAEGEHLAVVNVEWREAAPRLSVWALVDVDGDGRISSGDYVTKQSYPVPPRDGARIRLVVKRV